jgi:hypothetical protein
VRVELTNVSLPPLTVGALSNQEACFASFELGSCSAPWLTFYWTEASQDILSEIEMLNIP